MNLFTYSYTVTCIQETEMYVLDQKNYERLIEKRNPQVIEMICDSVLEKYTLRLSWVKDKKEVQLYRYLLYKIVETERKKKLKKEEMMRQDKERESPEDWALDSLKKGPLVDMFGPGSVFYAIRMKAKQREMERLSYKARTDKRRTLSDRDKQNKLPSNVPLQGANSPNFVTQVFKPKYDKENQVFDFSSEHDVDSDSVDANANRAHLVCDNSHAHSLAKEPVEQDFEDWESSDANLCNLENRLQKWYKHFDEGQKKGDISIVKLRRFQSEVNI